MASKKTIVLIFINLNILGLIALIYYSNALPAEERVLEAPTSTSFPKYNLTDLSHDLSKNVALKDMTKKYLQAESEIKNSFVFEDSKLAQYALNQLDVDQWYPEQNTSNFSKAIIGLKFDELYCAKVRAYFAKHPEEVFQDFNVIMDFPAGHLARGQVLPMIGTDLQKWVTVAQVNETKYNHTYNLSAKVNGFFINDIAHTYQQIGKSFACLYQSYNHVPGHGSVNRKDKAAESLTAYNQLYVDRPQCFNSSKFFPKTWILYLKDQCEDFFTHLNSSEYQQLKKERVIPYIRKQGAGAHMAKGVQPIDEVEEKDIRTIWRNGTLCGKVKKNYIVQTFVHNPLLVEGHKFDFRIYMLIASTNPMILYYHDGFLRVSVHKYDINSTDKSVLLTNTELSKDAFKQAANGTLINGMNETELRNFQMWNFTRLENYLLKNRVVSDPNWIENYLRPEFKKAMIHLIRMSQSSFSKLSAVYELFGVDFMLDEDLNLWFLECNSGPVLTGTSEEKEKFMITMIRDHFEIVKGLLRSRNKRIITYINKVVKEMQAFKKKTGTYKFKDTDKKQEEFRQVIKNKFEPEFEPLANNTWHKIIDENLYGSQRYMNLIEEKCL